MKPAILLFTFIIFFNQAFSQCDLSAKKITIFKDGIAYVQKEGICDASNEEIVISELSTNNHKIIFGSVNINCPDNKIIYNKVENYTSFEDLSSIQTLIENNKGIKVKVQTKDNICKGDIFSLKYEITNLNQNQNISTLVLRNNEEFQFIPFHKIITLKFLETAITSKEINHNQLTLKLDKSSRQQSTTLSYLERGITWSPNYNIILNEDQSLNLTLNALIINDAETLSNVDIDLAVGVPNFKFSNIFDPMTSNITSESFLLNFRNQNSSNLGLHANFITSQTLGNNQLNTSGDMLKSKEESSDDFFMYKLSNINLDKREKLSIPILDLKSSYEDIYVVDLKTNNQKTNNQYVIDHRKKEKQETNFVWHAIKFKNVSDKPLTTGSVFFTKSQADEISPISQTELSYTPVGDYCITKMAISPQIYVSEIETEIKREKLNKNYFYYYSHKLTVEGVIEVTNYKDTPVSIEVNRTIEGQLLTSDVDWTILKTTKFLNNFNQINDVNWKVELGARETKKITYSFDLLIR